MEEECSISFNPKFVGRHRELTWLAERMSVPPERRTPAFVVGAGGVGKTALVEHWIANNMGRWITPSGSLAGYWRNLFDKSSSASVFLDYIDGICESRSSREAERKEWVVVVDGAEPLEDSLLQRGVERLFALDDIRGVVVTSRREPDLKRADILRLSPLDSSDAERLFRRLTKEGWSRASIADAIAKTHGYPLAIAIMAQLLNAAEPSNVAEFLSRPLYDASQLAVPHGDLIASVRPRIAFAKDVLIEQLRRQPDELYNLPSRRFEELVADLLGNMGWRVELTPATRDGGKDILAFLQTDLGEILCLVEAKRHGRGRKVGVGLVRTLYGTLCDYQANSAMLITTSSFTRDAREFQQRHRYQLSLKDYSDLIGWLQRYPSFIKPV